METLDIIPKTPINMYHPIEERPYLLWKHKEPSFKYFFIEDLIVLTILSLIGWGFYYFVIKSFTWWDIIIDIALTLILSLLFAFLRTRWYKRRQQEGAYFKEKYGKQP